MAFARISVLAASLLVGAVTQLSATTIYLGSNATGTNPLIQVLDTSGNFLGNFGTNPSSAAALDGAGHIFTVTPGDTSSTVYVYNQAQAELANFLFTAGIDNGNGFPNYLTDVTWDGTSLWASAYDGYIYHLSPTGTLLSSFDTGIVDTGVTTDGTYLYTTSGLGLLGPASLIYRRDFQGNILSTINTGLNDTLGIGYDKASGSFFVGGVDVVTQVGADGSVLNAFANDGYHTGLEVGDVGTLPGEVPEPASIALTGAGVLAIAWLRKPRHRNWILPFGLLAGIIVAGKIYAAPTISGVTGAPGSAIPVGTKVTLTTSASDTDPGALRYRYRVNYSGGAYSTVVDYGPSSTFNWTPATVEGNYSVEVSVLNRSTGHAASTTVSIPVASRVLGGVPVVNGTEHPMVALYSAPPCTAGTMRVRFKTASQVYWQSTSLKPCNGQTSMNFYIAGMYANTAYTLRNDVINGPRVVTSGDVTFTTGALGVTLPATSVPIPLQPTASMTEGFTLFMPLGAPVYAVDKDANPVWYLPSTVVYGTRIAPGVASTTGSPLDLSDATVTTVYGLSPDLANSGFREYDLAGNLAKDTSTEQVNAQLAGMGLTFTLNGIHHEVRRLADGRYLLLGMTEVISDAQGPNTDILGDVILLLDKNLQILWHWNAFDHLDVTRKAVLNETCSSGVNGCVVLKAPVANDWTHGNSVALAPDGNLIYSSRHQDFVYKIAFQNGTGDGHVIWRLGKDGDFTWNSSDPYPWQSHQHDAEYEGNSILSLFDNGNTRHATVGGNSRGQVLQLDENARTVSLTLNADLGSYSAALGSAQRLSNGNYSFDAGFISPTQSLEVNKAGTIVGRVDNAVYTYRTFRLRDLYSGSW